MARARKPAAPKPAPEKPPRDMTARSYAWTVIMIDLPCGHSLRRDVAAARGDDTTCDICEWKRRNP